MMEWRIVTILLLLIQSTSGQGPSAPNNVTIKLEFINGNPSITGRWNAPVGTAVEQYLLAVTVNGSSPFNTTVPANNTSVEIFEVFPNIIQRRYTTYSLRVASVNNFGQSYFTDPVSIVSNLLQSASVIGGVRRISASCVIAKSRPKALCIVVVSNNAEHFAYTFQTVQTHATLDYAPGEYDVRIRIHEKIDGNFVIIEESTLWSISVLSVTPLSSSTMVLSSTMSSSPLSPSATSLLSTSPSSSSSLTMSDGNNDRGSDGGSGEVSVEAIMVTLLVCALILSLTVMFTVTALVWWKCRINRKSTTDTTTVKMPEKARVHSTVSNKTDNTSFCEELDTIKDERYSVVAVGGAKSRINSALASNHSSYIEMHPCISVGYLAAANSVVMQSNPSYSTATTTTS